MIRRRHSMASLRLQSLPLEKRLFSNHQSVRGTASPSASNKFVSWVYTTGQGLLRVCSALSALVYQRAAGMIRCTVLLLQPQATRTLLPKSVTALATRPSSSLANVRALRGWPVAFRRWYSYASWAGTMLKMLIAIQILVIAVSPLVTMGELWRRATLLVAPT
jgi:hypothetical protein